MCLSRALLYAAWGWRVLPLRPGSKIPLIKDWPNIATTDSGTVTGWWTRTPTANLGIATGAGLVVLDVDDKNGHRGSATLAALERERGDLPPTWTVGTPSNGVHHYFTCAGHLGNSAGKLGDGLDVRADGGQVAAPPSVVDDRQYVVLLDTPVAPAPSWLIGLLRSPSSQRPSPYERPGSSGSVDGLLKFLANVQPGGQDSALHWAVCSLRDKGLTWQEAGDLLWPVVAAWPCSRGPWTVGDIQRHLRSAYSRGVASS
jgi:hypothetical protein